MTSTGSGLVQLSGSTVTKELIRAITLSGYMNYMLYGLGTEYEAISAGYNAAGNGSVSATKEAGDLLLTATRPGSGGSAQVSYATAELIDLANVDTLVVDWENTGTVDSHTISRLQVCTSLASYTSNVAMVEVTNAFARTITSLDVSALDGKYYVTVVAAATGANTSTLKAYKIHGERSVA